MKYKVVFVLQALYGGGAERLTLTILRNLDKNKFEPVLFLMAKKGAFINDIPDGVKVVYGTNSNTYKKSWCLYYLLKLLLVSRNCDVIVGALEKGATYLAYAAGLILRKPVIGFFLTYFVNEYGKTRFHKMHKLISLFVYSRIKYIICISKAISEGISTFLKVKEEQKKILYTPVEIDNVIKKSEEDVESKYHKIFQKRTIVSVGHLNPGKGFDILIKAHKIVLQKGIDHNLLILGEGPIRLSLETLIKDLQVSDSVSMPGFADNPFSLMRRCKLFVLSSHFEGLSTVIIEAMALGLPVISTRCGGPVEVLEDGQCGILVPLSDPNALADAIGNLLLDQNLQRELSKKSRQRAKWFSPPNMVPGWQDYLEDVIQKNSKL